MNRAWPAALLAGLAMLAGCSAQVTLQGHTVREGRAEVEKPAAGAASVRAVTLTFTPAIRQQLQVETNFDADEFLEAVSGELAERGQLDAAGKGPELEILVDALEVKPTGGNAFMGNLPADGRLGGRVRLLGVDLVEQRSFNVLAEAQVGIPREGRDPGALRALYDRFAQRVAKELAAGEVTFAAEDAAPVQELANAKTSDQVMAASWTRQSGSYVLLIALDRSRSSTRKPSGIPRSATLGAEQAQQLAGLQQRARDEARKQAAATSAPVPRDDRSTYFIGNTIANLRGVDPWLACDRMLTLMDGRRGVGGTGEAPPPRWQPPSTLNQSYPPTLKESRVEAWLLKSNGTQILPVTYSCDPGITFPPSPAVEISYMFNIADSVNAVAAAIRIDGDYYIDKLQPLGPRPTVE